MSESLVISSFMPSFCRSGKLQIVAFLSKLPKTEHDLSTFTLDVPFTRYGLLFDNMSFRSYCYPKLFPSTAGIFLNYIIFQPEFDDVHSDGAFQRERHKAERVHSAFQQVFGTKRPKYSEYNIYIFRCFIVVPQGGGFCIINETLFIRYACYMVYLKYKY